MIKSPLTEVSRVRGDCLTRIRQRHGRRSSFVTTRVTPAHPTPAAARRIPIRASQSVVDVDAVITYTERSKAVALRGESSVLR
jgi:hypothetical protein